MTRKDDFMGVHGRWPTIQYFKVGVDREFTLQAIQLRGYSGMGGDRKNSGSIGGMDALHCPKIESTVYPVHANRAVSGNFRGPEFPQGYFGFLSMMDDVAYKVKMDPVEFAIKNMVHKANDQAEFTNYTLEQCVRRGAEAFDWKNRWRPQPGSDRGPIKSRRRDGVHGVPLPRGPQQCRGPRRFQGPVLRSRRRNRRRRGSENHHGSDRPRSVGRPAFEGNRGLERYRPPVFGRRIR
jgi:CO/xanthine dehydrogenase Mo-binding subunit